MGVGVGAGASSSRVCASRASDARQGTARTRQHARRTATDGVTRRLQAQERGRNGPGTGTWVTTAPEADYDFLGANLVLGAARLPWEGSRACPCATFFLRANVSLSGARSPKNLTPVAVRQRANARPLVAQDQPGIGAGPYRCLRSRATLGRPHRMTRLIRRKHQAQARARRSAGRAGRSDNGC